MKKTAIKYVSVVMGLSLLILSFSCSNAGQKNKNANILFKELDSLIETKQFFLAQRIFKDKTNELTPFYQLIIGARLDNVFNRLDSSKHKIEEIFNKYNKELPDSLKQQLLAVQQMNYGKLFQYKKAYNAITDLVENFKHLMEAHELNDYKNTQLIWRNLSEQLPQTVHISQSVEFSMKKDKAGLNNLPVYNGNDSSQFIFDTGANLSTTTETNAQKFGMVLMNSTINVTSITGEKVKAKLAICKNLSIKDIHLQNIVFLVFPDKALYIPQISYQINGIIGFPVINALGEVHITKSGIIHVPVNAGKIETSNMAIDFLTPVLNVDDESYTFDTGADETMLYRPYFNKYRSLIEKKYTTAKLGIVGVGGKVYKNGYWVKLEKTISGKSVVLDSVMLFSDNFREKGDKFYGNIGQDVISKFGKMVLNFKNMYIRFE
jgi:predicted aspartyl protease